MHELIGNVLNDLNVTVQRIRIYTQEHPLFKDSLEVTYCHLSQVLQAKDELVVGIIGDELAFEKEIFFDLSKKLKWFIHFLTKRQIERIIFHKGLQKEELHKFFSFLTLPEEQLQQYLAGGKELQTYLSTLGVKNVAIGRIKVPAGAAMTQANMAMGRLHQYEESLEKIPQYLETLLNQEAVDYLDLRTAMIDIMETLMGCYNEFLKLSLTKKQDSITFVHLLNTSILSMYISSKMRFAKDDVLDIGIAALFHDIGKAYISHKIMRKPEKLTSDEFTVIKSHTVLGAEFLLRYIDTLGILPAIVAFEHHVGYDLKGYPKMFFAQSPHIASLIVSMCDVYDALTQRRTYKQDYPSNVIYNLMMQKKGAFYESQLLENFFKIMGVWPTGTIVALSDTTIAIVREVNENDIFSPKVEIISPTPRQDLIDLVSCKDKLVIVRSLNPLTEGAQYLPLI
jgi:putative nucleotidyltransferase with HDIG domain